MKVAAGVDDGEYCQCSFCLSHPPLPPCPPSHIGEQCTLRELLRLAKATTTTSKKQDGYVWILFFNMDHLFYFYFFIHWCTSCVVQCLHCPAHSRLKSECKKQKWKKKRSSKKKKKERKQHSFQFCECLQVVRVLVESKPCRPPYGDISFLSPEGGRLRVINCTCPYNECGHWKENTGGLEQTTQKRRNSRKKNTDTVNTMAEVTQVGCRCASPLEPQCCVSALATVVTPSLLHPKKNPFSP